MTEITNVSVKAAATTFSVEMETSDSLKTDLHIYLPQNLRFIEGHAG
jgi:hypothetical protein